MRHVLKGGQIPAQTFAPPGTAGYTSTYTVTLNASRVRNLQPNLLGCIAFKALRLE